MSTPTVLPARHRADYLNGEIARIARRLGTTAPINAGVASLARQAAASGARPGDISAAELAARLGLQVS